MESKKISVKGLAVAGAVCWGGAALLVGTLNLMRPGYGQAFLDMLASIYPLYTGTASIKSVVLVTAYALLDGTLCGLIFALIYNLVSGCYKTQNSTKA